MNLFEKEYGVEGVGGDGFFWGVLGNTTFLCVIVNRSHCT